MTDEQIIEMAKQAGMTIVDDKYSMFPFLQAFAQLVAALVRNEALEDCADVCQKAGYLAMDIHIRDLIRKSKQQVFADVIGKMKK